MRWFAKEVLHVLVIIAITLILVIVVSRSFDFEHIRPAVRTMIFTSLFIVAHFTGRVYEIVRAKRQADARIRRTAAREDARLSPLCARR